MKKIFMYIHSLHIGGGAENVFYKIALHLQSAGFEIAVCGLLDEQPSFEADFARNNIKVIRLSGQDINPLAIILKLTNILKIEKPDIMFNWLYPCIMTGGIAGRLAGVKTIISNLRGPDLKKRPLKIMADLLVSRLYNGYIAVSPGVAAVFRNRERYNPDKFTIIPNGINLDDEKILQQNDRRKIRQELGLREEDMVIGSVGRLYVEKNQKLLIWATAELIKFMPRLKLVLVGDGPNRGFLEALVQKLGLAQAVIFAGWQKDIYKYLKALDLYVLPSRYEGHPGSILQAWLAKLPVVGAKVIGIKELVTDGKNGLLFSADNVKELASIIFNLAGRPDFAKGLAERGYQEVLAKYSEEKMYKQYTDYFRKLSSAEYQIIELTSRPEIENEFHDWQKFSAITANPFADFAIIRAWTEIFLGNRKYFVLKITDLNQKTVGYAPFYREGTQIGWLGEGRVNYLDLLCDEERKPLFWELILNYLKNKNITTIYLPNVNSASASAAILKAKNFKQLKKKPCPFLSLNTQLNWENYYNSILKNKRRYEVRKSLEELQKLGLLRVVNKGSGSITDTDITASFDLYKKRWAKTYRRNIQHNLAYFAYQGKLIKTHPQIFLSQLFLNDRLISFMLGFKKNKTFTDYIVAHDPEFTDLSLGNLHIKLLLEELHKEGFQVFDFSIGEEIYKRKWAKAETWNIDYITGSGIIYWRIILFIRFKELIKRLLRK